MKNKHIIIVLGGSLVLILALCLFHYIDGGSKVLSNIFWEKSIEKANNRHEVFSETRNPITQSNISLAILLTDAQNRKISIDQLLRMNEFLVVYRLSEKSCNPCIRDVVQRLNLFYKINKIDPNRFIIISDYSNHDNYLDYNRNKGTPIRCFNYPFLFNAPCDSIKEPYLFILKKDGFIENISPQKKTKNFIDQLTGVFN